MGWPKGMPRKGHINKDGTPHKGLEVSRDDVATDDEPTVPREEAVESEVSEVQEERPATWGAVGSGAVSSPCPKCGYAYADGGWCQECGWTKPIKLWPYGTFSGKIGG